MKYVVWKVEDVLATCTKEQLEVIREVGLAILEKRTEDGKNPNNRYYVINTDEPYADKVKELIEQHEGEL